MPNYDKIKQLAEMTRPDLTRKGPGFFGPLKRPDRKVSSELSIGVDFNGRETLIPSLVPGLTQNEITYLLGGGRPTKAIADKATANAKMRMAQGKSPFAQEGEQVAEQIFPLKNPLSAISEYLEKMLKGMK